MSIDIPTTEPSKIMAGTTWEWIREDLSDYSAVTYTLKYYLVKSGTQITLTASAYLTTKFKVSVAKATTAGYSPGIYTIIGVLTDATTATEIYRGTLEVLPDLSASLSTGYDTRSSARIALEAMDAALVKLGPRAYIQEITIADRVVRYENMSEFMKGRSLLLAEVNRELAAEKIARGLDSPRRVGIRFTRV